MIFKKKIKFSPASPFQWNFFVKKMFAVLLFVWNSAKTVPCPVAQTQSPHSPWRFLPPSGRIPVPLTHLPSVLCWLQGPVPHKSLPTGSHHSGEEGECASLCAWQPCVGTGHLAVKCIDSFTTPHPTPLCACTCACVLNSFWCLDFQIYIYVFVKKLLLVFILVFISLCLLPNKSVLLAMDYPMD